MHTLKRNKTAMLLAAALVLLLVPIMVEGQGFGFGNRNDDGSVWETFLGIFELDFLVKGSYDATVNAFVAFMRFLLWTIIFTIAHLGLSRMNLGRSGVIISMAIATIASIFMPAELLLSIGMMFTAAIAWLIIGSMVVGIFFLYYQVNFPNHPRETAIARIFLLSLLLYMTWIIDEPIILFVEQVETQGQGAFSINVLFMIYHPGLASWLSIRIRRLRGILHWA